MARARLLKPGFFTNEAIVELPPFARLLFQGLWLVADREGRLEDRPKRIKMELFPGDNIDVDELLAMLADAGLIQRYAVNGQGYIAIPSFLKHQNPHHREQESVIPPPETLGQASPRQGQALGEAGTSRAVTVTDPVPVPDPVSVAVAVRDDAAAAAETEIKRCMDAWTSATGQTVTRQTAESIADWCERVSPEWVLDAIEETGRSGARAWKYTHAILQRWETQGRQNEVVDSFEEQKRRYAEGAQLYAVRPP